MDWSTIISAFLAGLMGSVIGPFVSAKMEGQKDTKRYQRERLAAWRAELSKFESNTGINSSTVYSEIRPYLSDETRKMIEGGTIIIRQGRGGNLVITAILDDLSELERKWKILE